MAPKLKDIPLWVFHGANDVVIPVELSDALVQVCRQSAAMVMWQVGVLA